MMKASTKAWDVSNHVIKGRDSAQAMDEENILQMDDLTPEGVAAADTTRRKEEWLLLK